MSSVKEMTRRAELLARHSYISELAELNRIAGNWSVVDREAHVVIVGNANPACQTAGTIMTLIGPIDDPDLIEVREAADVFDKQRLSAAYVRLGRRAIAAEERAARIELSNVHGVVDLTYRDRTILRNVVVDAEVGFNIHQLQFDGGNVDVSSFRLIEHQIRTDATPLTAVMLVKQRDLSQLEQTAERLSPSQSTAAFNPSPRASFIDAVADAAKDIGHDVVAAAKVLACVHGVDVNDPGDQNNPQAVAGFAEQQAAQKTAEALAEMAAEGFGFASTAGSGTGMRGGANVDDLLDYRAGVLKR
ncbi:MAG TPA: hypothetical protein VH087_13720 [Thermoanaerobaculia bacterium]|nr:hypothetical protein [Thermoanaerobaculia bacterium]